MAGYIAEGKLWIELVDLYAWLTDQGVSCERYGQPRFSVQDDALVLEPKGGGDTHFVDAAELWAWVMSEHLPRGLSQCEVLFGVPVVDGPDLVVAYAASTECSPRDWATPPAFLADWGRHRALPPTTPRRPDAAKAEDVDEGVEPDVRGRQSGYVHAHHGEREQPTDEG